MPNINTSLKNVKIARGLIEKCRKFFCFLQEAEQEAKKAKLQRPKVEQAMSEAIKLCDDTLRQFNEDIKPFEEYFSQNHLHESKEFYSQLRNLELCQTYCRLLSAQFENFQCSDKNYSLIAEYFRSNFENMCCSIDKPRYKGRIDGTIGALTTAKSIKELLNFISQHPLDDETLNHNPILEKLRNVCPTDEDVEFLEEVVAYYHDSIDQDEASHLVRDGLKRAIFTMERSVYALWRRQPYTYSDDLVYTLLNRLTTFSTAPDPDDIQLAKTKLKDCKILPREKILISYYLKTADKVTAELEQRLAEIKKNADEKEPAQTGEASAPSKPPRALELLLKMKFPDLKPPQDLKPDKYGYSPEQKFKALEYITFCYWYYLFGHKEYVNSLGTVLKKNSDLRKIWIRVPSEFNNASAGTTSGAFIEFFFKLLLSVPENVQLLANANPPVTWDALLSLLPSMFVSIPGRDDGLAKILEMATQYEHKEIADIPIILAHDDGQYNHYSSLLSWVKVLNSAKADTSVADSDLPAAADSSAPSEQPVESDLRPAPSYRQTFEKDAEKLLTYEQHLPSQFKSKRALLLKKLEKFWGIIGKEVSDEEKTLFRVWIQNYLWLTVAFDKGYKRLFANPFLNDSDTDLGTHMRKFISAAELKPYCSNLLDLAKKTTFLNKLRTLLNDLKEIFFPNQNRE